MSLDSGLSWPWPERLVASLQSFRQGDVVESPPLIYFADLSCPVFEATKDLATNLGNDVISYAGNPVEVGGDRLPPYGMITTQTCDIAEVRSRPIKPWIQVAPIFDVSEHYPASKLNMIEKGRAFYLVHLPKLPGFSVADLRIEVPIEKGWLTGREPILGFSDEDAREAVGSRLAQVRSRPALPDEFVDAVHKPLIEAIESVESTNESLFGAIVNDVEEVGVQFDSIRNPVSAQVIFLTKGTADASLRDWLNDFWDGALERSSELGLHLLPFDFRSISEMTVSEYKRLTRVPLDHFSPSEGG